MALLCRLGPEQARHSYPRSLISGNRGCAKVHISPEWPTDLTSVCGYGAILQYFIPNPNGEIAASFGLAMFAISLTTNSLVTLLTAGRIWWVSPAPRPVRR